VFGVALTVDNEGQMSAAADAAQTEGTRLLSSRLAGSAVATIVVPYNDAPYTWLNYRHPAAAVAATSIRPILNPVAAAAKACKPVLASEVVYKLPEATLLMSA
jgi:hypothetical protein